MAKHGLPEKVSRGHWVQTERAAHESWAKLIKRSPLAAQILHVLTARIGEHNAVVISQKNLARLVEGSERGVRDALRLLAADRWLEVRQIGGTGAVNAYVINDRVAWAQARNGLRYSLFSAAVVLAEEDQPDRDELSKLEPLRRLPAMFSGERQLPSGDGLPPPSQPFLDGLEPDLPARETGGE